MIARRLSFGLLLILVWTPTYAQTTAAPPPPEGGARQKPAPPATQARPAASQNRSAIRPRAFATFGGVMFQAKDSFEAVLGVSGGPAFGGGGQVLLPWGLYAEVAAWHFSRDGERAFVGPGDEVFPLGIPLAVTVTPLEITGGWRYRHCPRPPRPPQRPGAPRAPQPRVTTARVCDPPIVPYAGAGFSSYKYTETSDFEGADEDIDERFNGFHLVGGIEYRLMRWIAVGGEATWSSVPDALGSGGVSAAFNEDNLGGTAFRVKITVGR